MKILLSAYACEPHKGSEPAVGWNWTLALIKQGHEVFVLTRSNNQASIGAYIRKHALNMQPVYFDLPAWCRRWKRWPGGLYLYYLLWQIGAYRLAKQLHREQSFDVAHHITFVTFRQPSFMGRLGIPFILGPVGGGEMSPPLLRKGVSLSGRLREQVRKLLIDIAAYDPMMNRTFLEAALIACTTEETLARIPHRFHAKCMVLPAIGIDTSLVKSSIVPPPLTSSSVAPHFLFIGRLLYWKGLHLILRAMPEVLQRVPNARLRVVGEGVDAGWLRSVADQCGVASHVDWIDQMPHEQIAAAYDNHVAFVFPSLHDSGGLVVLESLASGLPVICLALGGPGIFVDNSCGVAISTVGQTPEEVQHAIATAMVTLVEQPALRQALSENCSARARTFSWERAAESLYTRFRQINSSSRNVGIPAADVTH